MNTVVSVDCDELYPFFELTGGKLGTMCEQLEITQEEHEWIKKTMKEFWEVQHFLREKYKWDDLY